MTIADAALVEVEQRKSIAARLAVLIVASAAVQLAFTIKNPAPFIVPDEILYSELGKSIGAGHLPAVRDVTKLDLGLVYPLVIAPAWALFADVTQAYVAARVIGAAVMALSAIPAYLLARCFLSTRGSFVVANFAVFLPSILFSGVLMTEVALYPVSLLVFLALATLLARPSARHQLLMFGAVALAVATKSLMIVMLPAYVCGIFLMALLLKRSNGDARSYLGKFRFTWGVLAGSLVALLLVAITVGGERRILGYNAQVVGNLGLEAVPRWFLLHLAELNLSVAVAPFLATVLVCIAGLRPAASAEERLFACVVPPTIFFLLLAIAGFSSDPHPQRLGYGWSDPGARMHERNMFAVVPLLFIGLGLWMERPSRIRRRWVGVAAVSAVVLVLLLPLADLSDNATFQAMALVPWLKLRLIVLWPLGGVVLATLMVFLLLRRRERAIWAVIGTVFAITIVSVAAAFASLSDSARDAAFGGPGVQRTWIDDAVGRDARVAVVWREKGTAEYVPPLARHRVVWLGEFFNRSLGPVYSIGPAMPYGRLPLLRATQDSDGVVRDDAGKALQAHFVLTCGLALDGAVVRRLWTSGPTVWRIERKPVRVTKAGRCLSHPATIHAVK